jgi:uncharacterized membrane protein YphA (DoxX/SURF4 family)
MGEATGAILLAGRFVLAAIFIRTGVVKLLALDEFRAAIANYKIVPARLTSTAAMAVATGETAAGLLLLLGIVPVMASGVLAALLVCFSAAIGVNLARGRVFDCGCGGNRTAPRLISWRHVGVNMLLAAVGIALALASPDNLDLLSGPRGLLATTTPPGATLPIILATALALASARMIGAAATARAALRSTRNG